MTAAFVFADTVTRLYLAGLFVVAVLLVRDTMRRRHDREGD